MAAFPELQMVTPAFHGRMITLLICEDEHRQSSIFDRAKTNKFAEDLARHGCISFGMKCGMAFCPLAVNVFKKVGVTGCLSLAWKVGKAIMGARLNEDPAKRNHISAIEKVTSAVHLCQGKITQ